VVANFKEQLLEYYDPQDYPGESILKLFNKFFKEIPKLAKKSKSKKTASHKAVDLKKNIHHNIPHTANNQETGIFVLAFVNAISENREIVCPAHVRKIIAHEFLQNLEQIHVFDMPLKNVLALQAESAGNSNSSAGISNSSTGILNNSTGISNTYTGISNSASRTIQRPLSFGAHAHTFENLDKKGNKKKDPDQKGSKSTREKRPKKLPPGPEAEKDKKGSQTVRTTKDEKNVLSKKSDSKKSSVSARQVITEEDLEKLDPKALSTRSVTTGRANPREKRKTVAPGTMIVETIEEGDGDKKRRISK